MITKSMKLVTARDADHWADDMLECWDSGNHTKLVAALSDWIWNNKPSINCNYEEFCAAHPEMDNEEFFIDLDKNLR